MLPLAALLQLLWASSSDAFDWNAPISEEYFEATYLHVLCTIVIAVMIAFAIMWLISLLLYCQGIDVETVEEENEEEKECEREEETKTEEESGCINEVQETKAEEEAEEEPEVISIELQEEARRGLKSLRKKLQVIEPAKIISKGVHYWDLPLAQPKLDGARPISQSCCIIAVSVAAAFFSCKNLAKLITFARRGERLTEREHLAMSTHKICPPEVVTALKHAIEKGGKACESNKRKNSATFTIPDAIDARNSASSGVFDAEKKSRDYSVIVEVDHLIMNGSLASNLMKCVDYVLAHPALTEWNLFCFILMKGERSITIIYRKDTDLFLMIDSNMHLNKRTGPTIATSNRANFEKLAAWMDDRLGREDKEETEIEVSLLQVVDFTDFRPLNRPLASRVAVFDELKTQPGMRDRAPEEEKENEEEATYLRSEIQRLLEEPSWLDRMMFPIFNNETSRYRRFLHYLASLVYDESTL